MGDELRWLARFVPHDGQIDRLLEMVWHVDDVPSVRQLTGLLSG
ncbi:MAG: hypothetical protein PVG25_09650 [Anaerolineae bacterium]|jgi:hypothetical protein